jgi:hypothetical protein
MPAGRGAISIDRMIDFASPRRPPGLRTLSLLFLFALALGLALVKPPPAIADGTTSVEVDVEGPGRVTGTEIDCPGDCLATLPWRDGMPLPARDLTAHPSPGWERVEWTGCDPKPDNPNVCTYYQDETRNGITARFVDTQAPTIDLPDFPEYRYIAAGSTHELTAAVTDNGEIDRVEFVDGLMVVTDTEAPWSGSLTFTRPMEGVKVLFARVYDTGGNSAEVSRRYHHDHLDPVVAIDEPETRLTGAFAVGVGYTVTDRNPVAVECAVKRPGATTWDALACDSSQTVVQLPQTGTYELEVTATDAAGRVGSDTSTIVVDRTAPAVWVAAGPAEGEVLASGEVGFAFNASDENGIEAWDCWVDDVEHPCPGGILEVELADGAHHVRAQARDFADNDATVERSFVVDTTTPPADPPPGGDPPPDGNPPGGNPPGGTPPGGTPPEGGAPQPAKRCVVPKIRRGTASKPAVRRLSRAGCRARTKKVRSAKVKRGRVVRLSQRAGRRLRHRATVVVLISRGR